MEIFGSQLKNESSWRVIYPNENAINEAFLKQAREWGYNAIVLENPSSLAKQYDFKVILKVSFDRSVFPFDEDYKKEVKNFIDETGPCDALFWHSPYFDLDCREHLLLHSKLKVELLLEELLTIETFVPVFYYVPAGVLTKQFTLLEECTGPKSFLVFELETPYFATRKQKSLPIVEGLCEEVPLLLSETGRLVQNINPGAFIRVDRPIDEGSYAACHLEAAAHAISGSTTFEAWGRDWLKRNRPEVGDEKHLFRALAGFAEKTQFFKAIELGAFVPLEELKMHIDGLAVEMKLFHYHINQKNLSLGKFFSEVTSYLEALKKLSQSVLRKN